jgi:hypothetical protein
MQLYTPTDFYFTYDAIEKSNDNDKMSNFLPHARFWGVMLDCHCAFILVPVSRTVLRMVTDYVTNGQGCMTRCWRRVFKYIPIDHALAFHRALGWFILFCKLRRLFFSCDAECRFARSRCFVNKAYARSLCPPFK